MFQIYSVKTTFQYPKGYNTQWAVGILQLKLFFRHLQSYMGFGTTDMGLACLKKLCSGQPPGLILTNSEVDLTFLFFFADSATKNCVVYLLPNPRPNQNCWLSKLNGISVGLTIFINDWKNCMHVEKKVDCWLLIINWFRNIHINIDIE